MIVINLMDILLEEQMLELALQVSALWKSSMTLQRIFQNAGRIFLLNVIALIDKIDIYLIPHCI